MTAAASHDAAITALLHRYGLADAPRRCIARLDAEVHRIAAVPSRAAAPAGPVHRDATTRLGRPGGADGDAGYALRILSAARQDELPLRQQLAWLAALGRAGLQVPAPVADRDGRLLQIFRSPRLTAPRFAVVVAWVPGRMLHASLKPLHLRRIGLLAAAMHGAASAASDARGGVPAAAVPMPDLAGWADGARRSPRFPPRVQAAMQRAADAVRRGVAALPKPDHPGGFIHGDLHLWNLLSHAGGAGAIDFDDCGAGHPMLDLAATLHYLQHPLAGFRDHRSQLPALREALLEGYAMMRTLPPDAEAQIELFIMLRMINTLEWIADDWPTPDHRPWGRAFVEAAAPALERWLDG